MFLNRAKEFNVKFNLDKIQFKVKKIKYCGHIISKNKIEMDAKYIKAITELERPTSKKQLLSFLGLLKFLNKFIPNLSIISAPLRDLTKDNVPFEWGEVHTQSFNQF